MKNAQPRRARACVCKALAAACVGLLFMAAPLRAADDASLAPFSTASIGEPPAAWRFATLPNKVATKFSIVDLAGAHVLKVESDESYGNLVHGVHAQINESSFISWRWRVDKLVTDADITTRGGDDSPAKLCVFFAFDASKLSLGERTKLLLAKSTTGQEVPTETLCYVWDNKLPIETSIPNAFTKRIRFIVLESGAGKLGQWIAQRRGLAADYLRAFADEAAGKMPEVIGIAVSADSDNTHGHGLAYFADITLTP